jgi:hypothetical protein
LYIRAVSKAQWPVVKPVAIKGCIQRVNKKKPVENTIPLLDTLGKNVL